MKIGIYIKGLTEESMEWSNWTQLMLELHRDNPDMEWEIISDEEQLDAL